MSGTFNSICIVISFLILFSCSKKQDQERDTPIVRERILKNLDSIYLLAHQIYLWNDQLEPIGHFNPSRFFNAELDEIMVYKNEIFEITRYAQNNVTKELYEFNPFSPGLPKYSSILSINQHINSSVTSYSLYNPFGISVVIGDYGISLLYVDPNSPSGKAGLKRGDQIISINSTDVDSEQSFLIQWKQAINFSFIKFEIINENSVKREVRLNAAVYEHNPVLKHAILKIKDKKIGFIAYNSFTTEQNSAKYLDPIFSLFQQQGITELILDLRYNQGGYQTTVNYLANKIAPPTADGKEMYSEHYNRLMQQGHAEILKHHILLDYNNQPFLINGKRVTLYDVDYSTGANTYFFKKDEPQVDLNKIYFIVSDQTASASELLINVLSPYMKTELIGVSSRNQSQVSTYGKPVGFFDLRVGFFDLFLSMYQLKNSNKKGDYFKGLKADHSVSDNPRYDFGSIEDPAIAFIVKKSDLKSNNHLRKNNLSDTKSKYIFNSDRLNGNVKDLKNLKFKK
ncbi:S41 family peptidase [Sphingobacterium faecium]|uniref:S41 family peptidase n=1 Tax=Sphingobacterium faecium TaxID=34087 RepID=UPI003DA3BABC